MLFGKSKQKTKIEPGIGNDHDDEEDCEDKIIAKVEACLKGIDELTSSYIYELKQRIKDLEAERKADREMLWAIINKFADKPAPVSATQAYLASKQQTPNSGGGFAAVDKAAATPAKK